MTRCTRSRIALAESLARREFEARVRALGQAEQARFDRRRELAGAERQRGRLVREGVDDVAPIRPGKAVVQGQEGPRLDGDSR